VRWALHDARWSPGAGCRFTGRVGEGETARFVAVEVGPDGYACRDYRDDPGLPGLAFVTAPEGLARALGAPRAAGAVDLAPVRYRPGSRCVHRLTWTGLDMHAKTFPVDPGDGQRSVESLAALTAALATTDGGPAGPAGPSGLTDHRPLAPPVVGAWPEHALLVTATVPGRSASAVLADPVLDPTQRAGAARRVGTLLARLHACSPDGAGPAVSPPTGAGRIEHLRPQLRLVEQVDRALAGRLERVLDDLERSATTPAALVLCHGAFRPGQVMVGDDGAVTLLDLDHVGPDTPAHDLGTALAHLDWASTTHPRQGVVLRGSARALLSGYAEAAASSGLTPPSPHELAWWHALGLVQVAVRRYRRLEHGHWPLVPALVDAAETRAGETRGLASPAPSRSMAPSLGLLDTHEMTRRLRPALTRHAAAPDLVEVASAQEVRTVPGQRTVVSYAVRGLHDTRPVPVIGKSFVDVRRAELLHEHLRLLAGGPFREGRFRVPEPVGLAREQRMVLYRAVDGVRLDRLSDPTRLEHGVRRAAAWLARLHGSDVALPRRFDLDREKATSRVWAEQVATVLPELAEQASALARRWATELRASALRQDVPLHKDFHAAHVLLGADVSVIDLDEARLGDPAFDVAHFATYLALWHPRLHARLAAAFTQSYAAATDRARAPEPRLMAAFTAYTWLKIAKQCAGGSGPLRGTSPERRAATAARALQRGLRCLDG
jgi:aminoglycoside phosphotransferase (APT) family kinase protein